MSARGDLPAQFGKYHILRKLDAGGMGTVYLADDTLLRRRVALKVPHFDPATEPHVLERFLREARIVLEIRHDHICKVYDLGHIDGIYYLTMEYLDGTPLDQRIVSDQPWEPRAAVALMCKLTQAVQLLHSHGVIHRDLKPKNVMLRPNGEPVLLDFGLARSVGPHSMELTASGTLLGTPAYMSPEQMRGDKEIGPATDIYSLGVILYELLAGERPFPGPSFAELTGQILYGKLERPSHLRPGLDSALDAVCMKALARQATARYASAAEFAAALAAYRQPKETVEKVPVVCPACGAKLKAPATAVGRERTCPRCKAQVTVTLLPARLVGAVGRASPLPNASRASETLALRESRRPGPFRLRRLLVGAGAAVLLLMLLYWLLRVSLRRPLEVPAE